MRELKVRVWDTKAKCYVKDPILFDNFGQVYVVCDETSDKRGTCLITHKPNVIKELYTGLKDKNGNEICEGDIVLDYYDGEDAFIVEWDKDTVSFILTDTDNIICVNFDNYFPDKELEIIGNINENPELLKKEK